MSTLTKFVSSWRKSDDGAGLAGADVCAVRIDEAGRVADQSSSAASLAALWEATDPVLAALVARVFESGQPAEARREADRGGNQWLAAVPGSKGVTIVARDTTLHDKVTEALMKSRALLKELLDSSADLAFEVDHDQVFRFLTPTEAFGIKTEDWLGRYASQFFWPHGDAPVRNPFSSSKSMHFDAVPVQLDGQDKRWLHFAVHPQFDDVGQRTSLRGTCRDMTARHLAERKARQDSLRFTLLQRITNGLNKFETAQELMDNASEALLDVLRADMVWAVIQYKEGLVPLSILGSRHDILDLDTIWSSLSGQEKTSVLVPDHDRDHLAIRLELGGNALGMVIISRDTSVSPWSSQEHQLLDGVAGVLTAAFSKAQLIDKLYRLSSKDDLTGLLNRRALVETIEARLKHQARTGQSGCLLFIDLDHFKEINDTLGHQTGDNALRLVAEHMQNMIRPCDYAGRYGGDEFVLWLEDVDADKAAEKAQALLDAMPSVRASLGAEMLRLNASVGICQSIAGTDFSFEDLADKADAVLYDVKAAGRGDIAIVSREGRAGAEE
ncbi:sensor domain-containing diguanylate cyclase [Kordiimonas aestuarii]|uniref:sensor domain-containing diguanylate cyclase n=1 Tax=Kordiimonas aestuarii TaxID=1005925 RepID=UPI0021D0041C|nr:sensor domain-containing diguanylate cyclase [Kordiimonas aestuarii]